MKKFTVCLAVIAALSIFIVGKRMVYAPEIGKAPEIKIEPEKAPDPAKIEKDIADKKLSESEIDELAQKSKDQSDLATKKENDAKEEINRVINQMNSYKNQPVPSELMDQFAQAAKQKSNYTNIKEEWQAVQDIPAVKEAAKKLNAELTLAIPAEPTAWQKISSAFKKTWANVKLKAAQLFGSKEQVIAARNELSDIYRELGSGGMLDKARNSVETARLLDNLQDKISTHIGALEEYKEALDKGTVAAEEQTKVIDEIEKTISDLLVARDNLLDYDIAPENREKIISQIDEIFERMVPNPTDRNRLLKDSGILTDRDAVQKQINDVRQFSAEDVAQWARDKKIRFVDDPQYKKFISGIRALERVNVNILSDPADRVSIKLIIRDGYKAIKDALMSEVIEDRVLDALPRQRMLDRWISLNDKYAQSENALTQMYNNFLKANGIPNKDTIADYANKLLDAKFENETNKVLQGVADRIVTEQNFKDGTNLKKAYQRWNDVIEKRLETIAQAPVNDVSLRIRQNILDNFYTKVLDNINDLSERGITGPSRAVEPEVAEVMLDVLQKIQKLSADITFDRSMLVIIKEGLTPETLPTAELVQENNRPFDPNKPEEVIAYMNAQMPYLSLRELQKMYDDPTTDLQYKQILAPEIKRREVEEKTAAQKARTQLQPELLFAIKAGPAKLNSAAKRGEIIKDKTAQEKLVQDINQVILKKVSTKGPLEPKDWWAQTI